MFRVIIDGLMGTFKNEAHLRATQLLCKALTQYFKCPLPLCPIKDLVIEEVPNHDKKIGTAVNVSHDGNHVCMLNLNVII